MKILALPLITFGDVIFFRWPESVNLLYELVCFDSLKNELIVHICICVVVGR